MPTLTISTALVAEITDSVTYRNSSDSVWEYLTGSTGNYTSDQAYRSQRANSNEKGSLLTHYSTSYSYGNYYNDIYPVNFQFNNASNTTLISWTASEITSRSIDANGYCVLSNFPEKLPSNAGTIDYILVSGTSTGFNRTITLTVGATGSGADVEFDDRTLVTNQPWRLDGTIKLRIPTSYTWST